MNSRLTPRQEYDQDAERRRQAQARRPIISKWPIDVPAGFIHIDDCIEYMHRRFGNALRAEMLEAFSRSETGPRQYLFGESPDRRGERYYKFDEVDLWVWRTMSGAPASFLETRGRKSTVPVTLVPDELFQKLLEGTRDGEEQGDGGTGLEKDGRWWDETSSTEDSDGGQGDWRAKGNGRGPRPS